MKLRKLILLAIGLSYSSMVFADWQTAHNTGQSETGDIFYTRCHYETIGGFRFSIIVKGFCPFSIEFNPETQQWRR